jgi:hypothetical protein
MAVGLAGGVDSYHSNGRQSTESITPCSRRIGTFEQFEGARSTHLHWMVATRPAVRTGVPLVIRIGWPMPINDSSTVKFQPELEAYPDHEPLGKFVDIELPDEAVPILNELMRNSGDTLESLFRKSLSLYKIAIDAKLDGYKVAIVDPEDNEFVQDIAGL